jgi:hypothetical protein
MHVAHDTPVNSLFQDFTRGNSHLAFVRRKIDRFNSALALASRAIPDVHSALRPTGQKIASQTSARDFVGANKTLNEGFASLEKLERGEQRNKKP